MYIMGQDYINKILTFCHDHLRMYCWRDGAEVFIMTCMIYMFLKWLNKDMSKKPILMFYGYCLITMLSYYIHLTIVSTLLIFATPIIVIALIILHQHSLQKNFIVHRAIQPLKNIEFHWIDELMRAGFNAANKHHEVIFIIERNDQLKSLLSASYLLNADIQKNVIELLIEHSGKEQASVLWVHHAGKIVGSQVTVTTLPDEIWVSEDVTTLPLWKQDAIFVTSKTDAIFVYLDPQTRLCQCIIQGKVISELIAHHALMLIKKHMSQTNKKEHYDKSFEKNQRTVSEQQRP